MQPFERNAGNGEPYQAMVDQATMVADGLKLAGHPVVSGTNGHWLTTTAICHQGDNTSACWFRNDGQGGLVAGCFTGHCDTRTAAPALRAAAGVPDRQPNEPRTEWREQCVYRHPDGYTSRRAMRYDWPGGSPCPVEFRRGSQAFKCGEMQAHKHIQHRAINDGPMPRGDRYAGYLLHIWEPLDPIDPTAVVVTEGEKDAMAVRECGYAAASYLGGSGKAGDADYRDLSGMVVVVWGDDDAKGRLAAHWVIRRAWEAGAARIHLVSPLWGETGAGAADNSVKTRAEVIAAALRGVDLARSEPGMPQPEENRQGGPGRPQIYAEDEYIVHRRNTRPRHWWLELESLGAPHHLRPDWQGRGSYQDALRVLEYQAYHILRVAREVYMAESSTGLWQFIQNGSSGLDMLPLIREARRQAFNDLKSILALPSYSTDDVEDALRTMTTAFSNGRRHSDNVAKDVASLAAAYRPFEPDDALVNISRYRGDYRVIGRFFKAHLTKHDIRRTVLIGSPKSPAPGSPQRPLGCPIPYSEAAHSGAKPP